MSVLRAMFGIVLTAGLLAGPTAFADDFAEGNAADWGTFASDNAQTSVADDVSRVQAGAFSIRFDTASGFDTGVRYPKSATAHWNLTGKTLLNFWAYAVNNTPYGFQNNQPVIVLKTATGDVRLEPQGTLMWNRAWHLYHVPLGGDATWTRTVTGTPDLADVRQLEIHQDTWDSGFTIFYDGVEFVAFTPGQLPPPGPSPPAGVNPDAVDARALLFVFDPIMENYGGQRMHQAYGWQDPQELTNQVVADLRTNSHDLARYQVAETVVVDDYPFFEDGHQYDDVSYDRDVHTGQWYPSHFDYRRFIADANIAARIQSGAIDEVWVYSAPGFGMWESSMAGDGGYWCNSGPVSGVPSERLFVVMGWNFERGVAEAIHSWGHRAESVMVHSYGSWQANRSTTWNAFTLLDKDAQGQGSVGNCHYPVNGQSDYDYNNSRKVLSDADDWFHYPNLTGQRSLVNNRNWSPDGADPHRQYLNWWYNRMPHMSGRGTDYYLANWWRYLLDVEQFKGWDGKLYYSLGLPNVAIASPQNGATVAGAVTVRAWATADGALGRVDLYVDGSYHSSDSLTPYTFKVDLTTRTGPVTLVAKAYELQNGTEAVSAPVVLTAVAPPAQPPGEVSPPWSSHPLRFTDHQTLVWAPGAESGAERFNVYRGTAPWLKDGHCGSCFAADLASATVTDPRKPWAGGVWFYLVTGENGAGEGPRGNDSEGAARPSTAACF